MQAVGSKTLQLFGWQQDLRAAAATYFYFALDASSRAIAVALLFSFPSGGAALSAATVGMLLLDLALQAWQGSYDGKPSIPAAVLSLFSAFPLTIDPGDRNRLCATASFGTIVVALSVLITGRGAPESNSTEVGNSTSVLIQNSTSSFGGDLFGPSTTATTVTIGSNESLYATNINASDGKNQSITAATEATGAEAIDPVNASMICLVIACLKLFLFLKWVRQLAPSGDVDSTATAAGFGDVFVLGADEGEQMAGWKLRGMWR